MKRLSLICILAMSLLCSFAQDCLIALQPIVTPSTDGNYFPQVESYLTNRLRGLTTGSGGASSLDNNQFALAASYDVVDKQIISGTPTKVVYNLSVSLFVVDLKTCKIYSSFEIELKGVGDNETKALINSFKPINRSNGSIKNFIADGTRKILDYYDNNYQKIIAKAKSDAAMKNFDAAIYTLMCVPECSTGYNAVLEALPSIYQQFVDQHCNENLAQARAAWYASPNHDGASVAGLYLSEIYPDAACYGDAQLLFQEIKKQMGEEWKFMMKQYNDAIEMERQRLDMMRDIAIAYANNQPKETIKIFW